MFLQSWPSERVRESPFRSSERSSRSCPVLYEEHSQSKTWELEVHSEDKGRQGSFDMSIVALDIAVQPPAVTRLGDVLDPPLALTASASTSRNGDLSKIWAFATLLNDYGDVVSESLSGSMADSLHIFRNGDGSSGYFLFDNLSIESVGSFRIRITLMRMESSSSGAAIGQQVESDLIEVKDTSTERQVAGWSEQRFLDALPEQC